MQSFYYLIRIHLRPGSGLHEKSIETRWTVIEPITWGVL